MDLEFLKSVLIICAIEPPWLIQLFQELRCGRSLTHFGDTNMLTLR